MVKIEAVIRPDRLDGVRQALDEICITGISVTEVRGAGQQRGYVHRYRGAEYTVNLLQKVKLEIVVLDSEAQQVAQAIATAARTGEIGDGKIFLTPVADVIRIRTGEEGEAALQ